MCFKILDCELIILAHTLRKSASCHPSGMIVLFYTIVSYCLCTNVFIFLANSLFSMKPFMDAKDRYISQF